MLRDVQVVINPPPNGVFTFEDTVTGKVTFESNRDEKLAFTEVFFRCWVSTHVVKQTGNYQSSQVQSANYKDKEVVFGSSKKVYLANGETLKKKVRYEWPFQFDFRSEVQDSSTLPSSGRYGNGSVEYKIVAMPMNPGQAANDQYMHAMMNPDDQLFQKNAPINLNGLMMSAMKHLGGGAEQELQFVKIRTQSHVGVSFVGPYKSTQEIAANHLPQLQQNMDDVPERHGMFHREPHIPFEVNINFPRQIIIGEYFTLLLSVTSSFRGWTENVPPAILVALKVHLVSLTTERASQQSQVDDRKLLLVDSKGLNIPLGEQPVDLSQIFPIRLAGDGIIPSFETRLMTRSYILPVEATIEIAGKRFQAKFDDRFGNFELLSQHVALGHPPAFPDPVPSAPLQKQVYQLKHSYIGRITQNVLDTGIKEASVMEAALATSRALTKYEVPHEFPGGSLIKILPYRFDRHHSNTTNFDKTSDISKLNACFRDEESTLRFPQYDDWTRPSASTLTVEYYDDARRELLTIFFPSVSEENEAWQKDWAKQTRNPADAINLDPISLFNYRLSCAISHEKLIPAELSDFDGLYLTFNKDLKHHRKNIDVNAARIAVGRYPQILRVIEDIGIDLEKSKGKEERLPPPSLDSGKAIQPGYEDDLVKGLKKHSFFHRKH